MIIKNKLLIFGGAKLQISIINIAKKLGYHTIVIDPDNNAICKEIADEFICVGANDYEKTLNIAKKNQVKGLVTVATDKPLIMMAKVASALSLPFADVVSIENTINKSKLKQILQKNQIPCAKGVLCNLRNYSKKIQEENLQFPLIIKPIDSSGSRGVFYCSTDTELKNNFRNCLENSSHNEILIEEFLEGPEISVEALIQNNELYIIQITDKKTTPFPYNVEMGHVQPSIYKNEYLKQIRDLLGKAVKVLGLNNCGLHPEIKITPNGLKIVEIGPRLGGDFITSHLTPMSTGINIEEQLINVSIGENINIQQNSEAFASVQYLALNKCGDFSDTLIKLKNIQSGNLVEFELYFKNISLVPKITNSLERHGHVIIRSESLDKLNSIIDYISNGN